MKNIPKRVHEVVAAHHERYDGQGYPDGLPGKQIPMGAKILAVADSYDAMTSGRPYRRATDLKAACAEIEEGKGSQFDPEVVEVFLRIFNTEGNNSDTAS